jgi:hypothetical protein
MHAFDQQRNEILALPVTQAHARVQQLIDEHFLLDDVNWWLGIAQAAAFDARRFIEQDERDMAMAWAGLSLMVYQHLARIAEGDGRYAFEDAAMLLRANLILAYGEHPDHPLLQLGLLKDWFFNSLPFAYEEAATLAAIPLPEQRIGDMRLLRQIKNRLRIFTYLAKLPAIAKDTELRQWLDLRPQLP